MQKHLPGKHNQKLHGSNAANPITALRRHLSKAMGSYGSAYVTKTPGGNRIVRVKYGNQFSAFVSAGTSSYSSVDILIDSKPRGFFNDAELPFSDYTDEMREQFYTGLVATENGIKKAGYSTIKIAGDELPITLANRLGYVLKVNDRNTLATDTFNFVRDADKVFKQYGLRQTHEREQHQLAAHIFAEVTSEAGLSPKHFMSIPHPLYPELSFFTEYLLKTGRDSIFNSKLQYVKNL